MAILLEPVSLDESTAIRARFFLSRSRRTGGKILVIKYDGVCRSGDDGETDGRYMLAMGKAGLTAWEPDGLVVDLTDLDCRQLVEGLTTLLYLCEGYYGGVESMPQAVVVGPRCEQAIGTFFPEIHSEYGTETMKEWAYEVGKAVEYVDEEVAKLDSLFSGKNRRPESPRDFGFGSPPG